MKVKASIRRRCTSCKIIKRKGVLRVICSANPRHKQRQGPGSFSNAHRRK